MVVVSEYMQQNLKVGNTDKFQSQWEIRTQFLAPDGSYTFEQEIHRKRQLANSYVLEN